MEYIVNWWLHWERGGGICLQKHHSIVTRVDRYNIKIQCDILCLEYLECIEYIVNWRFRREREGGICLQKHRIIVTSYNIKNQCDILYLEYLECMEYIVNLWLHRERKWIFLQLHHITMTSSLDYRTSWILIESRTHKISKKL